MGKNCMQNTAARSPRSNCRINVKESPVIRRSRIPCAAVRENCRRCFDRRSRQWQMHVAYNEWITRKRFFRVQVQLNCEPIAAVLPIAAAGAKARPRKTTIRGGQTWAESRAREYVGSMRDYSPVNLFELRRRAVEMTTNVAILARVHAVDGCGPFDTLRMEKCRLVELTMDETLQETESLVLSWNKFVPCTWTFSFLQPKRVCLVHLVRLIQPNLFLPCGLRKVLRS